MKYLLVLSVVMLISGCSIFSKNRIPASNQSSTSQFSCVDRRAAILSPCKMGEERVYQQGRCEQSYEFENTSCISESHSKTLAVLAEVEVQDVGASRLGHMFELSLYGASKLYGQRDLPEDKVSSFMSNYIHVSFIEKEPAPSFKLHNCKKAFIVLGVGVGNVLPFSDGRELRIAPTVNNFVCLER